MTNNRKNQPAGDALRHPEAWMTGDEPMTAAQESYVHTLAREAGEDVPENMRGSGTTAPTTRTSARR